MRKFLTILFILVLILGLLPTVALGKDGQAGAFISAPAEFSGLSPLSKGSDVSIYGGSLNFKNNTYYINGTNNQGTAEGADETNYNAYFDSQNGILHLRNYKGRYLDIRGDDTYIIIALEGDNVITFNNSIYGPDDIYAAIGSTSNLMITSVGNSKSSLTIGDLYEGPIQTVQNRFVKGISCTPSQSWTLPYDVAQRGIIIDNCNLNIFGKGNKSVTGSFTELPQGLINAPWDNCNLWIKNASVNIDIAVYKLSNYIAAANGIYVANDIHVDDKSDLNITMNCELNKNINNKFYNSYGIYGGHIKLDGNVNIFSEGATNSCGIRTKEVKKCEADPESTISSITTIVGHGDITVKGNLTISSVGNALTFESSGRLTNGNSATTVLVSENAKVLECNGSTTHTISGDFIAQSLNADFADNPLDGYYSIGSGRSLIVGTKGQASGGASTLIAAEDSENENAKLIRIGQGTTQVQSNISLDNIILDELTYGYSNPSATDIVIRNDQDMPATITDISIGDTTNFELIKNSNFPVTIEAGGSNTSFKIKAKNGLNAGSYTTSITVTDNNNNNYTGQASVNITRKQLTATISIDGWTYGNTPNSPSATGLESLTEGTDYDFIYQKGDDITSLTTEVPSEAGSYKVLILPKNGATLLNYELKGEKSFEIAQKECVPTITDISPQNYTGKAIEPTIEVKTNGIVLDGVKDYTLTYENNINVGTASVKIASNPESNYKWAGTVDGEFTINKITPTITLSNLSQTAGNVKAPTFEITPAKSDGKVKLEYKLSTDEDSAYSEILPTQKGNYIVKASLEGDKNLNDCSVVDTFTIRETSNIYIPIENTTIDKKDENLEKTPSPLTVDEVEKILASIKSKARSEKTAKGNIKISFYIENGDLTAIKESGYTIKYKFYRSTRKSSKYEAMLEGLGTKYINTKGKRGTRYYYKAKIMVYDGDKLIGSTALKTCKYATRIK